MPETLTGHEDHDITLAQAKELTTRFRNSIVEGEKIAGYFGRDAILRILNQDDCVGIRYYYGLDGDNKPVTVLVGVKENSDDIYTGELAQMSWPCPDCCSSDNPLNSDV